MDDFALSGGSDSDPEQDSDSPGQLDSARTIVKGSTPSLGRCSCGVCLLPTLIKS